MNAQIEWFCHHAVEESLLTREQCLAVAQAMRDAGVDPDLNTFAQVVVDNELCTDVKTLERLMEMAVHEARALGPPARAILDGAEAPAPAAATPPSEPAEGAEEAPADAAAKEGEPELDVIAPEAVPPPEAPAGAVGRDWPDLSRAEHMTREEARDMFHEFLACARRAGCSDVHVSAGAHPFVRLHKLVYLLEHQPVLTPEATLAINYSLLTMDQRDRFERTHDLDYTYAATSTERYRTNVMLQRLGVAGSYRVVDNRIRTLRELGFPRPEVIEKLTTYHQGLILVTGPGGCGKSTTLSALVDMINRNRTDHIITVEDPVEVIHPPKSCNVTQREVGTHTRTWAAALRAALREDPDIIVIGELRDLETIEMAIRASETGHLVIGTLHTSSAASTMDRVLDVFPPNQQAMIRAMAAESLKGVICQQLIPNLDHSGVVLAVEIMLGTLAVANNIREGETFKLPSVIQTAHNVGMCLMEESIVELYMEGKLSYEQTLPKVRTEEMIKRMQINEAQRAAKAAGLDKKKGWFGRR